VTGTISGTSNSISLVVVQVTHFSVVVPAMVTAKIAFNFIVQALDANNGVVTGYTGTVHFTSSAPGSTLPAGTALTNGVGTFSAALTEPPGGGGSFSSLQGFRERRSHPGDCGNVRRNSGGARILSRNGSRLTRRPQAGETRLLTAQ